MTWCHILPMVEGFVNTYKTGIFNYNSYKISNIKMVRRISQRLVFYRIVMSKGKEEGVTDFLFVCLLLSSTNSRHNPSGWSNKRNLSKHKEYMQETRQRFSALVFWRLLSCWWLPESVSNKPKWQTWGNMSEVSF